MPFFIVKVFRTGELVVTHTFPDVPLAEADTYRRAQAQLRELRRAADPSDGFYLHLVYGEDEQDAKTRLKETLS